MLILWDVATVHVDDVGHVDDDVEICREEGDVLRKIGRKTFLVELSGAMTPFLNHSMEPKNWMMKQFTNTVLSGFRIQRKRARGRNLATYHGQNLMYKRVVVEMTCHARHVHVRSPFWAHAVLQGKGATLECCTRFVTRTEPTTPDHCYLCFCVVAELWG